MKQEMTNEENDLIEANTNYKRAYPNGQKELLHYAVMLFEEMIYG